jgi:hypothetical protein
MNKSYYKLLYLTASLYDTILGFMFLFFYKYIYQLFNMNIPSNPAYLSFCAAFIGVYGLLLFMIYRDIDNSRKAVIFSIFVKFAFFSVVMYYWLFVGSNYVDAPFRIFAFIDLIFGILFIESLKFIKK